MKGRLAFYGLLLAALALSWFGLVVGASVQETALVPKRSRLRDGKVVTERDIPPAAESYRRLGCFECHARQVGPADIDYGWGKHRTGPREWLEFGIAAPDEAGLVGFSRMGPDLASLSSRWKKDDLVAFLKDHHGGGSDAEGLAEWLLVPEPKPPKEAKP